ncbi:MAG TPA: ribonuclease III [Eubacteriaceae bacterium]|nr:ribonuclease III [Eubacteriaceae bacterium]
MQEIERIVGYTFQDKQHLKTALTHSSSINDRVGLSSNERLEFLGDAVLELVISEHLYENFPNKTEGELTKLRAKIVCTESLSAVSMEHRLGEYIFMGKGEVITGGRKRKSILANIFEAIVGAIYVDGGYSNAKKHILKFLRKNIREAVEGNLVFDYKTKLQEVVQKQADQQIRYAVVHETGPEHQKIFHSQVTLNGKVIGKGQGANKKNSEQMAAYKGLVYLGVVNENKDHTDFHTT